MNHYPALLCWPHLWSWTATAVSQPRTRNSALHTHLLGWGSDAQSGSCQFSLLILSNGWILLKSVRMPDPWNDGYLTLNCEGHWICPIKQTGYHPPQLPLILISSSTPSYHPLGVFPAPLSFSKLNSLFKCWYYLWVKYRRFTYCLSLTGLHLPRSYNLHHWFIHSQEP